MYRCHVVRAYPLAYVLVALTQVDIRWNVDAKQNSQRSVTDFAWQPVNEDKVLELEDYVLLAPGNSYLPRSIPLLLKAYSHQLRRHRTLTVQEPFPPGLRL